MNQLHTYWYLHDDFSFVLYTAACVKHSARIELTTLLLVCEISLLYSNVAVYKNRKQYKCICLIRETDRHTHTHTHPPTHTHTWSYFPNNKTVRPVGWRIDQINDPDIRNKSPVHRCIIASLIRDDYFHATPILHHTCGTKIMWSSDSMKFYSSSSEMFEFFHF